METGESQKMAKEFASTAMAVFSVIITISLAILIMGISVYAAGFSFEIARNISVFTAALGVFGMLIDALMRIEGPGFIDYKAIAKRPFFRPWF